MTNTADTEPVTGADRDGDAAGRPARVGPSEGAADPGRDLSGSGPGAAGTDDDLVRPERLPGVPTLVALAMAIAAGGALLVSFPRPALWWLAPVGVALIMVAVHRRTFWGGFRMAGVTGLVFFVPLLWWTHIVGGMAPWLLLATAEAFFVALTGAAAAYSSRLIDRRPWLWPLATAVLWVGQEAIRDRAPFGGFPWGRLAFSQGGSPMLRYAAVGGAPLVTFAVALAGGLLALAVWQGMRIVQARRQAGGSGGRRWVAAVTIAIAGAAIVPLGFAVPLSAPDGRAVQVAIVQGNVPRLGLDFNAQRRAVLDNHVRATLALADRVAAGAAPRPDVVIWPENSSDIDPLVTDDPGNADAAAEITQAANTIGAPILVGAVLEGPGSNDRNAAIVWLPGANGGPQSGPHGTYVKQHPVPFAEYIPLRGLARVVSKRVDLVAHDFAAGTTPGVLTMNGVTVGDAICFEVAYDNIVRNTVTGGAQLLTVQTNNADFNSAEAAQQLAMVRLRAVEHGRDALMASTVGISGFVDASGGVHQTTGFNVVATQLRELRLGEHRTLATRLGPVPEFVASGLAIVFLLGAALTRRSQRSPRRGRSTTAT